MYRYWLKIISRGPPSHRCHRRSQFRDLHEAARCDTAEEEEEEQADIVEDVVHDIVDLLAAPVERKYLITSTYVSDTVIGLSVLKR